MSALTTPAQHSSITRCHSHECPVAHLCFRHKPWVMGEVSDEAYFVPPPIVWVDKPRMFECLHFWPKGPADYQKYLSLSGAMK